MGSSNYETENEKEFIHPHFLSKALNSWNYFRTLPLLNKAYEKIVQEPFRFRGDLERTIPEFAEITASIHDNTSHSEYNSCKKLIVIIFTHYFYPDKQGGTERFILNLSKELKSRGHRIIVVTLGKRTPKNYTNHRKGYMWQKFKYQGIEIIQFRFSKAPLGLYYRLIDFNNSQMKEFTKELFQKYNPDLVHLAYPQPFATVVTECENSNIPICLTATDFNLICHFTTLVNSKGYFCSGSDFGEKCKECKTLEVKDQIERYINANSFLSKADVITVPSKFVQNVFHHEFPEITTLVVPHGIQESFFTHVSRHETRNFLFVGTLSALKGVHLLVESFMLLGGNYSLTIIGSGDGTYEKNLRQKAIKDSRIRFLGSIASENMHTEFQKADCVVIPSIWFETYNFVLREALATGCLVIASNMGAMPEVIVSEKNGFIFESGSQSSLLEKLEEACSFSWTDYKQQKLPKIKDEVDIYEQIYFNLLHKRGGKIN